jgi:photosystem II stability/assembly factor-like uncharacterized protein
MNSLTRTFLFAILALVFNYSFLSAQGSFWQKLEKPYGGGAFIYAFAPNGDIIVGTERDGTFRSTDHGLSWNLMGGGKVHGIYVLAVNAQGELFGMTDDRGGFHRSSDDGATWEKKSAGMEQRRMHYVAMTENGGLFTATDSGIYRSTDKGESWSVTGLAGTDVDAVFADGGTLFALVADTLYRSVDGATWTHVGKDLWNERINGIAFTESATYILAGNKIFRSTNDGAEFALAVTLPEELQTVALAVTGAGDFLTIDRTRGLLRVSPTGDTTLVHDEQHENMANLAIARNGNIMLAYERMGIYTSTDNGGTWKQTGMPYSADVMALAELDGAIYAGMQDFGVYRSTDAGMNWTRLKLGADFRINSIDTTPSGTIFIGGSLGAVVRSTDGGSTWVPIITGHINNIEDVLVTRSGAVLLGSRDGLVRSADNGNQWAEVMSEYGVYMLAQAPNGTIWAGGSNAILYSEDDGLSWSPSFTTTDAISFTSMAALPNGTLLAAGFDTTLRSTDGGATWHSHELGCSERDDFEVVTAADGTSYLTTWCGFYRMQAGADTWSHVNDWDDETRHTLLASASGFLYAGGGHGIYRSTQSVLGVEREETAGAAFHLSAVPNPARTHATITFSLPKSGPVSLTIHSARGDMAATLVDRHLPAGEHAVEWNAEGAPSGVYLYQLRGTDGVAVGKIELVR